MGNIVTQYGELSDRDQAALDLEVSRLKANSDQPPLTSPSMSDICGGPTRRASGQDAPPLTSPTLADIIPVRENVPAGESNDPGRRPRETTDRGAAARATFPGAEVISTGFSTGGEKS